MKIAFITNFCPYYRVKPFETLARYYDVDFYFFSAGDEWYWQKRHGLHTGDFHCEYLPGLRVGRTRIVPTLPGKLFQKDYDVYIKCINGRFVLPVCYFVAKLKRRPFILWTGLWMRLQTPLHRLFFPIVKHLYRRSDALVVYGKHVKSYLIEEGASSERIFIADQAVDNEVYGRIVLEEEKIELRDRLRVTSDEKVILYVGRLEDGKGLSLLLEAFSLVKNLQATLVLVGEGNEKRNLELLAQKLGVDEQVRFVGYVSPRKIVPYYSLAWVHVLPSVTTAVIKETWGLVVNEAFNQGVPVVVTEAVGAAAGGLVQDGVNGFVVAERNSVALAEKLRHLLEDKALRHRMGLCAREIIKKWNHDRMVYGFREAIEYVATYR